MINGTETVHRHRENTIAVGLKCIAESGTMYLSREQKSSIALLISTTTVPTPRSNSYAILARCDPSSKKYTPLVN